LLIYDDRDPGPIPTPDVGDYVDFEMEDIEPIAYP
jgi:hypothetical protein